VWLQVLVVGLDAVYGMELRFASTPAGQLTLKDLLGEVHEERAQARAAEAERLDPMRPPHSLNAC
jgi:hypothetical protein